MSEHQRMENNNNNNTGVGGATSIPSSPSIVADECNTREPLLSPSPPVDVAGFSPENNSSWRLDLSDFRLSDRSTPTPNDDHRCSSFGFRRMLRTPSTSPSVTFYHRPPFSYSSKSFFSLFFLSFLCVCVCVCDVCCRLCHVYLCDPFCHVVQFTFRLAVSLIS